MNKVIKFFIVRLTGKEITLIVAALTRSNLVGAKELAKDFLREVVK